MNRLEWMIVIVFASVAACTASGGGSSDRGPGRVPASDSGALPARDSGIQRASDAGVYGASDSGAASGFDAGMPAACATDIVPAPTTAACAAATGTCLDACTDATCFDTCLASDPGMGECALCLDDAFLSCANAAGCQAQWDALMCCIDTCADPSSEACFTTTCAAQASAYDACASTQEATCGASGAVCFPG